MTVAVMLSLLTFSFVTVFTPGPNVILTFSTAKTYGFRRSCPLMAGISSGFFCIMALSAVLTMTLNGLSESFTDVMKYVGAVYIGWLAWKVARTKPVKTAEDPKVLSYRAGFFLQFVNVKTILYGVISFSGFIVPYDRRPVAAVLGVIFLWAMGAASLLAWGALGSVFQRFLNKYDRAVNILMALLLLESAVSLLVSR